MAGNNLFVTILSLLCMRHLIGVPPPVHWRFFGQPFPALKKINYVVKTELLAPCSDI